MPTARQTVRRLTELRSARKQLAPLLAPAGASIASRLLEASFDKQDLLDLLTPEPPKRVAVIKHYWKRGPAGDPYHTITIYVDGEKVTTFRPSYSAGLLYEYDALRWLVANGYVPEPESKTTTPWGHYENLGIKYLTSAHRAEDLGMHESACGLLEASFDKQDLLDLLAPDAPPFGYVLCARGHVHRWFNRKWSDKPGALGHFRANLRDATVYKKMPETYSSMVEVVPVYQDPRIGGEDALFQYDAGVHESACGLLEASFDKQDLLDLLSAPKKIEVHGRRWYQRSYGGVYHVSDIYVDGEKVATVGPAYGYGDGYEQTAMDWLIANSYLPPQPEDTPPWAHLSDLGIEYRRSARDVKRERDLFLS